MRADPQKLHLQKLHLQKLHLMTAPKTMSLDQKSFSRRLLHRHFDIADAGITAPAS